MGSTTENIMANIMENTTGSIMEPMGRSEDALIGGI